MTNEAATAFTDIALCAGTFFLGLTVGEHKNFRTWTALFMMLALASGLGAVYHGTIRFHTPEFWVVVATTSTSSAFLLLGACLCATKPSWAWLHWLWPLMAIFGMLVGGFLAPAPFWYISVVSGVCLLASAFVLKFAPSEKARNWIYIGMVTTILGLVAQKVTHFNGLFSNNALFHLLQLAGNYFFWLGARRT